MADTQKIEQLEKLGGKRWTKAGGVRVYFNDLPQWFGLRVTRYNTGNISSATLDGEPISNSQAQEILEACRFGKLWWDSADEQFHWRGLESRRFNIAEPIIDTIKGLL